MDEVTQNAGTPGAPAQDTAPQVWKTLTIDGEEVPLTEADAIARLQKSGAAEKRLQEASQLVKQHKSAISFWNDIQAAKNGDQDAWTRIGLTLGYDENQIAAAMNKVSGDTSAPAAAPTNKQNAPASLPGDINAYPEPMRTFFKALQNSGLDVNEYVNETAGSIVERGRAVVENDIKKDLASDPNLTYYLKNPDQALAVANLVKDAMRRRHLESGGKLQYGPELRQAAIADVRVTVKQLGIQPTGGMPPKAPPGLPGGVSAPTGGAHRPAPSGSQVNMYRDGEASTEDFRQRLAQKAFELGLNG